MYVVLNDRRSAFIIIFIFLTKITKSAVLEKLHNFIDFYCMLLYNIGIVFFFGYYAVIDNLINILFDYNLTLSKAVSIVITINYFVQYMRQATNLFRDANGIFYYDRWRPIIEGVVNIILSIALVILMPADFKVVGVLIATILTNLFICHIVDPHVLYKYAFHTSTKKYYIRNYLYIIVFIGLLFALHFSMIKSDNQWVELFANGGISLAFSLAVSAVVILTNKDFRHYATRFLQKFKRHPKQAKEAVETAGNVDMIQTDEDNPADETKDSPNDEVIQDGENEKL